MKTRAQRGAARTPASCRSRGARARACSNRFTVRHMVVRLRSRGAFGPATHPRFPSRIVRLPLRATSLARSGRRARTPSLFLQGARHLPVFSFRKKDPSLRARVGRGPSATPVHSTDVCNSRLCFQGMLALRLGALRAVFPHAARERSIHVDALTSASSTGSPERCLLRSHRLCVPLTPRRFAGSPAERDCVHRRRPADRLATILGSYPRA